MQKASFRVIFLFITAFLTLALAPKGNAPIGHNTLDAHKLVDGRCRGYLAATKAKISNIFKDEECDEAAKIVAEDASAKSVDIVVNSLSKFLEKLPSSDDYSQEEKLRYILYGKSLREPGSGVEELVEGCLEDKTKAKQNRPACRVATEVMLEKLKEEQEAAQTKAVHQEKYKENYKRYFEENPAEIDNLLNGRCKKILENPWYKFDISIHDKECDAAIAAKDRADRKALDLAGTNLNKNKEYFSKNIFEAREVAKKCEAGEADVRREECAIAVEFVKEQSEYENNVSEYKKYWGEHLGEARKFIKEYELKTEMSDKDKLRFQIALLIVNQEVKKRKEARRMEKYKENFRSNIEDASRVLASGCVEDNMECDAAEAVLEEHKIAKSNDALMVALQKYLEKNKDSNEKDKSKYDALVKGFKNNKADVEEFVLGCINDPKRAAKSRAECNAAVSALYATLEEQRNKHEKSKDGKVKNREYFMRQFASKPDAIESTLKGRCKDVFADPWYGSDDELTDVECDTALSVSRANAAVDREKQVVKNLKTVKDRTYFIKNNSEALVLSAECKSGKIANLEECEDAMYVVTEKSNEEIKKGEYTTYYNGHPLAAKFFVRWCKKSMLNFDVKCTAAANAIEKYNSKKPKIYKDEIFEKHLKSFKEHPELAKELLLGKCKALFEDPWYYLDESIRSEKCDAAAEIARLVMDAQNKKKAASSGALPN